MQCEPWRMSRTELREVLNRYEKAVEEDALGLLRPSAAEKALLGVEALSRRAQAVRKARDANRKFVEAVIEDIPDLCALPGEDDVPRRPVCAMKPLDPGAGTLPSSSYGSMASVFLHLLRDWSSLCEHVGDSTYGPAVAKLRELLPGGGEVLLPGAGLGRLALQLAAQGFRVEANDASRLFLTFADYILNRPTCQDLPIYPLAHVFSENWAHDQQYLEVKVPMQVPQELLASSAASQPAFSIVPGDFVKMYSAGGSGHRKFDAILTCFFIDTTTDPCELFHVMDNLLVEGGVWVNVGPLNWRKEARMKLNWDEVMTMWKALGYEFVSQQNVDCDYHLPRGQKMYTESYQCVLSAAVKGKKP